LKRVGFVDGERPVGTVANQHKAMLEVAFKRTIARAGEAVPVSPLAGGGHCSIRRAGLSEP
jgi:hypothetical protein